MNEEFENFNDQDEEWLAELEIRAADLENDLFDWREAHARELTETNYGRDGGARRNREARNGALKAPSRQASPGRRSPGRHRRGNCGRLPRSQTRHCITSLRTRTGSRTTMT